MERKDGAAGADGDLDEARLSLAAAGVPSRKAGSLPEIAEAAPEFGWVSSDASLQPPTTSRRASQRPLSGRSSTTSMERRRTSEFDSLTQSPLDFDTVKIERITPKDHVFDPAVERFINIPGVVKRGLVTVYGRLDETTDAQKETQQAVQRIESTLTKMQERQVSQMEELRLTIVDLAMGGMKRGVRRASSQAALKEPDGAQGQVAAAAAGGAAQGTAPQRTQSAGGRRRSGVSMPPAAGRTSPTGPSRILQLLERYGITEEIVASDGAGLGLTEEQEAQIGTIAALEQRVSENQQALKALKSELHNVDDRVTRSLTKLSNSYATLAKKLGDEKFREFCMQAVAERLPQWFQSMGAVDEGSAEAVQCFFGEVRGTNEAMDTMKAAYPSDRAKQAQDVSTLEENVQQQGRVLSAQLQELEGQLRHVHQDVCAGMRKAARASRSISLVGALMLGVAAARLKRLGRERAARRARSEMDVLFERAALKVQSWRRGSIVRRTLSHLTAAQPQETDQAAPPEPPGAIPAGAPAAPAAPDGRHEGGGGKEGVGSLLSAATRLQAFWRGYYVRRHSGDEEQATHPPQATLRESHPAWSVGLVAAPSKQQLRPPPAAADAAAADADLAAGQPLEGAAGTAADLVDPGARVPFDESGRSGSASPRPSRGSRHPTLAPSHAAASPSSAGSRHSSSGRRQQPVAASTSAAVPARPGGPVPAPEPAKESAAASPRAAAGGDHVASKSGASARPSTRAATGRAEPSQASPSSPAAARAAPRSGSGAPVGAGRQLPGHPAHGASPPRKAQPRGGQATSPRPRGSAPAAGASGAGLALSMSNQRRRLVGDAAAEEYRQEEEHEERQEEVEEEVRHEEEEEEDEEAEAQRRHLLPVRVPASWQAHSAAPPRSHRGPADQEEGSPLLAEATREGGSGLLALHLATATPGDGDDMSARREFVNLVEAVDTKLQNCLREVAEFNRELVSKLGAELEAAAGSIYERIEETGAGLQQQIDRLYPPVFFRADARGPVSEARLFSMDMRLRHLEETSARARSCPPYQDEPSGARQTSPRGRRASACRPSAAHAGAGASTQRRTSVVDGEAAAMAACPGIAECSDVLPFASVDGREITQSLEVQPATPKKAFAEGPPGGLLAPEPLRPVEPFLQRVASSRPAASRAGIPGEQTPSSPPPRASRLAAGPAASPAQPPAQAGLRPAGVDAASPQRRPNSAAAGAGAARRCKAPAGATKQARAASARHRPTAAAKLHPTPVPTAGAGYRMGKSSPAAPHGQLAPAEAERAELAVLVVDNPDLP